MTSEALRRALVETARQAYAEKLFSGTSGNLSVRDGETMLITPTSVRYEELTTADAAQMDLEGKILSGIPSSEWRMHAEIYKKRPDVRAIVHTHSPYATAFAAAHRPIPACLIEMKFFLGGEVPCAPYAPAGTRELGLVCAEALGNRGGCLMANHGALSVGKDLPEALLRAEYIEDSARIALLSMQLGGPVPLPEE